MTAMADLEYGPGSSMLVEIVGDVFTGLFGERYAPPYLADARRDARRLRPACR